MVPIHYFPVVLTRLGFFPWYPTRPCLTKSGGQSVKKISGPRLSQMTETVLVVRPSFVFGSALLFSGTQEQNITILLENHVIHPNEQIDVFERLVRVLDPCQDDLILKVPSLEREMNHEPSQHTTLFSMFTTPNIPQKKIN